MRLVNSTNVLPTTTPSISSASKEMFTNTMPLARRVEHGVDWKNVQLTTSAPPNEADLLDDFLVRVSR